MRTVSLDSVEFIRASGPETHDLVVIHFSTEVNPCEKYVALPPLEFFQKLFHYNGKDPVRVVIAIRAAATYGSELMVQKTYNGLPSSRRGFTNHPAITCCVACCPRNDAEFKKQACCYLTYKCADTKAFFMGVLGLKEFVFQDRLFTGRNNKGDRLNLAFKMNSTSCRSLIADIDKFCQMIDRGFEFLDRVKVMPSGFRYGEFSEIGDVSFVKVYCKDESFIREQLDLAKMELKGIAIQVRDKLLPLEDEVRNVWKNKYGTKCDLSRVGLHYALMNVALDPGLYVNDGNSIIQEYASRLISGG